MNFVQRRNFFGKRARIFIAIAAATTAASFFVVRVEHLHLASAGDSGPGVRIVVPADGSETPFSFTVVALTDQPAVCSWKLNDNETMVMKRTGGTDHRQFFLDLLPKHMALNVICVADGKSTTAHTEWNVLLREPAGEEEYGPTLDSLTFDAPVLPIAQKTVRELANDKLPEGAPVDALVKTTDSSAIYYIGDDAKRHSFPNGAIFFTWYTDFNDVRNIDAITLASIPLGTPVMVKPGTFFVKITSSPKTYSVEPGPILRWIKDEKTARAIGGDDWQKKVLDIDPAYFTLFTEGEPILL